MTLSTGCFLEKALVEGMSNVTLVPKGFPFPNQGGVEYLGLAKGPAKFTSATKVRVLEVWILIQQ